MTPFRLTLVALVATFALLLIGGAVNPTGSSLACPDWPLCWGEWVPEMTGGVLFENSHRLAAEAVGLLVLILAVVTWRTRGPARRFRGLVVVALLAVVVQGVLGGITVLLHLPTLVSTAHLALATAFFLLLVQAALRMRAEVAELPPAPAEAWARRLAALAFGLTYAQVVLGGFMRHTGAGRACGTEVPTCGGEWWPELWASRVHQLHRGAGVALALLVVPVAVVAWRAAGRHGLPLARLAAAAAPVLVVVQVVLGVLTVTSAIGLAEVEAHFGVGILLVADLFVLWRGLGGVGVALRDRPEPAVATADAPCEIAVGSNA